MNFPPFDPAKVFYPLIMNFAVQMLGFKEIMAMGHVLDLRQLQEKVFREARNEPMSFEIVASRGVSIDGFDLFYPYKAAARELFPYDVNLPVDRLLAHTAPFEIVGPRALKCVTEPTGLDYSAEEIAENFRKRPERQLKALAMSGASLLIAAYEATKHASDKSAVWEFLRHCRNAAAHGGRFHFKSKKPAPPACWKSLTIEPKLEGTPLFDNLGDGQGLIALGDAVLLLWDIEQIMP